MKVLIIIGHPQSGSFNHALAEICKDQLINNGHSLIIHDLFQENFHAFMGQHDPAMDNLVNQHQTDVSDCDAIIIIHPNWWGQPPAVVKGWIECVFVPGIAYRFEKDAAGKTYAQGLLKAGIAFVINTSNTSEEQETELFKDPLETIWKNRIFGFCGIKNFHRLNFNVIKDSTANQRTYWLKEVSELIPELFPKDKS